MLPAPSGASITAMSAAISSIASSKFSLDTGYLACISARKNCRSKISPTGSAWPLR